MNKVKASVYKNQAIPAHINMNRWYFLIPGRGYGTAETFAEALQQANWDVFVKRSLSIAQMSKEERYKAQGMYCATRNGLGVLFDGQSRIVSVIYPHDRKSFYSVRANDIVPLPDMQRAWGENQDPSDILAWMEAAE